MTGAAVGEERVRFGGRATARGFLFELSGGAACLDFANTADARPTPSPQERLASYSDLLSWSEQSSLLTAEQCRALEREAGRHPRLAESALTRGRQLREALFRLFSAVARGRAITAADLATVNASLADALAHRRLAWSGTRAEWVWADDQPGLDRPLWPVVASAAELLASPRLERVRECAAPTCAWLFLDHSRNRSRRWCDMTVCGNREKVSRHRQRARSNPVS